MGLKKRYAFHMKEGPTVEGLLVRRTRLEYVLIGAEILEDVDRSQPLSGHVFVPKANVFVRQEIK